MIQHQIKIDLLLHFLIPNRPAEYPEDLEDVFILWNCSDENSETPEDDYMLTTGFRDTSGMWCFSPWGEAVPKQAAVVAWGKMPIIINTEVFTSASLTLTAVEFLASGKDFGICK